MNDDKPEKKPKSAWKSAAPGIIVSLVVIAALAYFVDFKTLISSFSSASWGLTFLLFVLQTVALFCRGLSWRVILDNAPSRIHSFLIVTEGYLLNLLPLRFGEVGQAVIMGSYIHKNPFYVVSTIILERIMDVIITLTMLLVTAPLLQNAEFSKKTYIILFGIAIVCVILIFLIVKNKEKFLSIMEKIFKPESKIGKIVMPLIRSLLRGMEIIDQPKKFFHWTFWILCTWFFWVTTIVIGVKVFFPELPIWTGPFVQSIGALGGAIPAAPAGLGVVEGAYVVALSFFGIGQSEALAFGLYLHSIGIVTPVIWGIVGFIVQKLNFSDLIKSLRNIDLSDEESAL